MTPATTALDKAHIAYQLHEYDHDPNNTQFGLEAVDKLGIPGDRVFKTLVVSDENNHFAVAVIPVNQSLNLKQAAKSLGSKKVKMANPDDVSRVTGYVLGGVSPLGQKRALPTLVDHSAQQAETIFISAGKRGLEIELNPTDLISACGGRYEALGVSK